MTPTNSYVTAQESYMDTIHLPDSNQAKNNWEETLYRPLRYFVKSTRLESNNTPSLLYVGCGPNAPLLTSTESEDLEFYRRFKNICLSDYSERYLQDSHDKITTRYPVANVLTTHHDITQGLSTLFFNLISTILNNPSDEKRIINQLNFIEKNISFISDAVFADRLNEPRTTEEKYDLICSEMVATYTGIPTLVFIEKTLSEWLKKGVFGQETILTAEIDLSEIIREKMSLDVTGHYSRPDLFNFSGKD